MSIGRLSERYGDGYSSALYSAFVGKKTKHSRMADLALPKERWQDVWREETGKQGTAKDRALYIHIPFCRLQCVYCGFFKNFQDVSRQAQYVEYLLQDIEETGKAVYCQSEPLKAAYFGGGTPGVLSPDEIRRLLGALQDNFNLAKDCEITFETGICDLDDQQLQACLDGGVTRFSFGVQTFDTKIRRSLGRPDDERRLVSRLEELNRCQGQAAIVIDLIYGLPGQTLAQWRYDLDMALASKVHGLDTYALSVFPGGRLDNMIKEGKMPPVATRQEQADFFVEAVHTLEKAGLRRLSICHWGGFDLKEKNIYNRLGKGYSGRIPLGAGGGGSIDGYRFRLDSDVNIYEKMIREGKKPLAAAFAPLPYHKLVARIKGGMDQGQVVFDSLPGVEAAMAAETLAPLLDRWESRGLLNRARSRAELTLAGQFWQAELTQELVDFLQERLFALPGGK